MSNFLSKFSASGISVGTVVASILDMNHGIHPFNAVALLCGSFASVCIGIHHLKKKSK